MFEKLSQELRDAREQAQLTLEQLARQIKIDIKFLQKIESGDLSFLPELYIKAYLRDYSEAVHLDPAQMMRKYQLAKEGKSIDDYVPEQPVQKPAPASVLPPDASTLPPTLPPVIQPMRTEFTDYQNPAPRQPVKIDFNDPKVKLILLAAGVLVIIFIAVYYFFLRDTGPEIVVDQPIEQTMEEQKRYEEPAQTAATSGSDSLTLRVEVLDTCWVQMVVDSTNFTENVYTSKTSFEKRAKHSIKLSAGNSAGINLFLNNQPYDFPKQRKRSAKFMCTREGIKQINISQ